LNSLQAPSSVQAADSFSPHVRNGAIRHLVGYRRLRVARSDNLDNRVTDYCS